MTKYTAEFLGTFIFVSAILYATDKKALWPGLTPLLIVLGLLTAIVITASSSGGHLNPAVSTAMWFSGSLSTNDYIPYMVAQILGAVSAVYLKNMMVSGF